MRLDIRSFAGRAVVAALVAGSLAACTSAGGSPSASSSSEVGALRVVATTTVLADLVAQVGGSKVEVRSLIPAGGEVHTYDPSPSDARDIAEADLVVINGLGLDDWIEDMVADIGTSAPVVALGEDLDGVAYLESPSVEANPHLWLNVDYARRYLERIGDALAAADPVDAEDYAAGVAAYDARLAELDAWVGERIATIPVGNRKVVSFHAAFPYFADAYGLTVVDTVLDAPGQDPSAGEIADLVAVIRDENVSAILSEVQFSDDLVRTIADETGAVVVSDLYSDSLGDPPVETYEGLIRYDTDRIVDALG
jgi:ABC-type Zn uptake system ZnuABC Zn-binding protein ZnuA